jgi:hypothetical protein
LCWIPGLFGRNIMIKTSIVERSISTLSAWLSHPKCKNSPKIVIAFLAKMSLSMLFVLTDLRTMHMQEDIARAKRKECNGQSISYLSEVDVRNGTYP